MAQMKEVKRTQLRKPYVPGVAPANAKTVAEIMKERKENVRLGQVNEEFFSKYL